MSAPQQALTFNDVFEEEDVDEPKSVHRIRANSSIMQLKKILGELRRCSRLGAQSPVRQLGCAVTCLGKSWSLSANR